MKRLILLVTLLSASAVAQGYNYPSTNPGYYGNRSEQYNPYHYQYRQYSNGSDEWKYAVGGLIVGAIIANQSNKAQQQQPTYSQPLPSPQKRKVTTCYDEVAYDSAGKPYVARQCYEVWQ